METDGEAIPRTWSQIWGLPLKSLRQLPPFKRYFYLRFHFRFRDRHFSYRCRLMSPMLDNVGSVIFGSGMVENVGVAVGIASPSISVQKFFPLPVSWSTFALPTSADVGQCRQCHIRVGHGRKCGGSHRNCFAIFFRSKVISTSGFHFRFRDRHFSYRCRPMSDNSAVSYSGSGIFENVG